MEKTSLRRLRQHANDQLAKHQHYLMKVSDEEEALKNAEQHVLDCKQAQEVIQLVAQAVQQQAHKRIAGVVTRCLGAVYDDAYEFQIIFERKRGKTEARLVFLREGKEVDPTTASGGGPVDVAAFALRLACLVLCQPRPRKLLVLDEPFRFVDKDRSERVRMLMELLAKEMGVQIVMVTHKSELQSGKVIELT